MKSILNYLNESKNITPKEFLNSLNDIEYDSKTSEEKYFIKSPKELLRTKKGICYDQVELEREYFKSNKFEFKTFFVYNKNKIDEHATHTFLVFKDRDKYYWFENSWQIYRGIHGPFKSYDEAIRFVSNSLKKSDNWERVDIVEYDELKNYTKMNIPQFAQSILVGKK